MVQSPISKWNELKESVYLNEKPSSETQGLLAGTMKYCQGLRFPRLRLIFFSKTLYNNLPVARAKQLGQSMKKTTSCKKATELPG